MAAIVPFLINLVVSYAVSYVIGLVFGKKADPQIISPKYEDNQAQVRSAVEPHKYVYGQALVSGPLAFAATNGASNKNMHLVVPLTGHEVESIDTVYFDDLQSDGNEFNKLEKWELRGYAVVGNHSWGAGVKINGKYYYGRSSNDYQGDHSRINTTNDVITDILICIYSDPDYLTYNFTATRKDIFTIVLRGKALNDEIDVQYHNFSAPVALACGGFSFWTDYPGVNDVSPVLVQKAHIFDLYKHLGAVDQAADADLVAANVGWTTDHRLRGRAYLYSKLVYVPERWPTGVPTIKGVVRGRKVYDPRTTLTAWSDNPALCVRDYLTASFGLRCSSGEIDDTSVIAAANICDELVLAASPVAIATSATGNPGLVHTAAAHRLRSGDAVVIAGHTGSTPDINGTHTVTVVDDDTVSIPVNITVGGTGGTVQLQQKRYTCNGVVTAGERPIDVVGRMLTSCDGVLVYSEGKYVLHAGAYTAPVGDLNESHLRSGLQITAKPSRKALFNAVGGTFVDPQRYYQETDFPEYGNSTYATQDGNEVIRRDITLPFTNDVFAAQRLAKQLLERSRQGIVVRFPAKLSAFKFAVHDVVRLSISYLGWVNKEFRVLSWSLADFGVDLLLQEEASAAYDWNDGDETIYDAAPDTTLPTVFNVDAPTGITLSEVLYQSANTAGVKSRIKATWTASLSPSVDHYLVFWWSFADDYQATGNFSDGHSEPVYGTEYHIEDVPVGNYFVTVVAVSALGVRSDAPDRVEIVITGNTTPPADVTGFTAWQNKDVVVFSWDPVEDIDLKGYEIRYGTEGTVTWDNASSLTIASRGTEVTSAVVPPGLLSFFIKAQDNSGLYSLNAAQDNLVVVGVSTSIHNRNHGPDWPGTRAGFVKHWTGVLFPDDQNTIDSYTAHEWCDTFVPTPVTACSYESPEIDIDFNDVVRCWAVVDATRGPGETEQPNYEKYIDSKLDGGSYDGFALLLIGFERARDFKFKFTHDPLLGKSVFTDFQTAIDKQLVTAGESNVSIAIGGTTVTFASPFHVPPLVSPAAIGSAARSVVISSVTTTGFTAKVFDFSGTDVGGQISYSATGV